VLRILPRLNEEINEEWISDKTRFCYDGLKYQRLDKPYVKSAEKLQSASFEQSYKAIVEKVKAVSPSEIAVLSGKLSSAEENYALKKFCEKLGIKNFDCRLSGEKFSATDSASYLLNTKISGIDESDACLLIGVNPRKDAPILNARLRKRFLSKKLKIFSVGVDADLTYAYENLGDDLSALKSIDLSAYKNPMLILGHDVITRPDGAEILNLAKKIAEKSGMIREDWNGFNFLSKSTGLLNGLSTGFVGSSNVEEILEKCASKEIKIVILHAVDDEIDFEKLKDSFVIYLGTHGDRGAHVASVILPAAAYSEKDATYINLEGRAQTTVRAVFAPGEAKEDWKIFTELAQEFGFDLGNKPDFAEFLETTWVKSLEESGNFSNEKIAAKNFDFYLTNPITRASRTLNKCSTELQ
jgi:NADH-quinone oxidoreductase subunit G